MKSRFVKIILGCALCISLLIWGLMYYVVSGRESLSEYAAIQFIKEGDKKEGGNSAVIQCLLGDLYLQMGRKQWCGYFDLKRAVEYYQQSAKEGEHVAFYRLGECYFYGHGVKQSQEKAVQYFQKAMEMGCFQGARRIEELTGESNAQAREFMCEELTKLASLDYTVSFERFFESFLLAMHCMEVDFYGAFEIVVDLSSLLDEVGINSVHTLDRGLKE